MEKARNFRNYKVWQDAVDYATKVYKVTAEMPWFEKKGLCDQLQRAAVSISSNIAEGSAKPSNADFARFLDTALGSAYEVETQLLIANKVGYLRSENENETDNEKELTYDEMVSLKLRDSLQASFAACAPNSFRYCFGIGLKTYRFRYR